MNKILLTTVIILAHLLGRTEAQTFPEKLSEQFQQELERQLEVLELAGVSAAIIIPEHGIWKGACGVSEPSNTIEMETEMLFWTGCIDMMFTSTVILQLVEEGKLDLEDSLYKWLPTYPNIDSTITIQRLLNHTNGLYRWHFNHTNTAHDSVKADLFRYWDLEEFLLTFIVDHPAYSPPGYWNYQETDYVLLNMIIEKITGTDPYIQYQERIGQVLDLKQTYFNWSDTISAEFAQPHHEEWLDFYKMAAWSIGGRRIMSTPADLATFAQYLFEGQLLSPTSLAAMKNFINIEYIVDPVDGYGLGLCRYKLYDPDPKELWGHWGFDPGFSSTVLYWPEKKISIAFFFNNWGFIDQTSDMAEALFGEVVDYLSALEPEISRHPTVFSLSQNYPNPFNPYTVIKWQLASACDVELSVYNQTGEKVKTLVSRRMNAGNHNYKFDGTHFASGIYYYRLSAGDFREVKKMILLK